MGPTIICVGLILENKDDYRNKLMKAMAVAPQPRAVEEAVKVLRNGGNAIDAAITAAFIQGVIDPLNCGIGGLGWMHIYLAESGKDLVVDFCSKAGSKATPDIWADKVLDTCPDGGGYILNGDLNEIGYQSIGVPTAIRGLHDVLSGYGTFNWSDTIRPSIELAQQGYRIPHELAAEWRINYAKGRPNASQRFSNTAASKSIYMPTGALLNEGNFLLNNDYASTLETIAENPEDFYSGNIAERLSNDWEDNGALVTKDDLYSYTTENQKPIRTTYRGYVISSTQSPSGGVTLAGILNILEGYDLAAIRHNSSEYIHLIVNALKSAFVDRVEYVGDPSFVKVPQEDLVSKERAQMWRNKIDSGDDIGTGYNVSLNGAGTTHISIVDSSGNCVSLTHTNGLCSGVVTPGLGFLQNNYMIAFDPIPGRPNSIAPGKKRTTGALPCIIFNNNSPFMVVGAPGGTYIISAVLQTILNVIDHGMTATEAVSAPRFDCQGNEVYLEGRISSDVCDELVAKGHRVYRDSASYGIYPSRSARVQAIVVDQNNGNLSGGSDPRGYGVAIET